MKLTIDTKHDSHEEIKHAIDILHTILQRQGVSHTQGAVPEPVDTTSMMDMFSTPSPAPSANEYSNQSAQTTTPDPVAPMSMFAETKSSDTAPDFSAFLNLGKKEAEQKLDEDPKIEFF